MEDNLEYMHEWYTGDSFEILEKWRNGHVDHVITDPPYDLTKEQIFWLHRQFERLIKPNGTIITFCPPENQWTPFPPDNYCFWIKPISTKNTSRNYSRFVEMIFIFKYGDYTWNNDRHWSQYTNVFTDLVDNSSLHPYRKPPSLIQRLILNHTNKGDFILDPFAGSGVVQDVCALNDRNSISIEKKEKYSRRKLTQS